VLQVFLHHPERPVAFLHPIIERVTLQFASALDQRQPEIGGAEIGLEAVLLEEHPLQRLGAIDAVLRRERGAARDVPEDCVGLSEVAVGRDLQQRHLAAGIHREELGRVALALEDIDLVQPERQVELGEGKPHLVAVARSLHRVEREHRVPVHRHYVPSIKLL
jgi:hypothetical protein